MRETLILALGLLAGFACGFDCAKRYWRAKADYWFAKAMDRSSMDWQLSVPPSFHVHPHFHATRRYSSLDALIVASGGSTRVVDEERRQ